MAEPRSIKWSLRAETKLLQIYNYLKVNWSEKDAENFLDMIQEFESLVSMFPKAFPESKKFPGSRLGLIHKYLTAVYLVTKRQIFVVTIFDNRMKNDFR